MLKNRSLPTRLIAVAGFMALLTSCAVTTRSTEGTSETFHNTSDASTEFTSSTSPRDEENKSEVQNVKQFAAVNLDRLKGDMARGGGEHLTAFAHLLGVKEAHRSEFYAVTKQNYPRLFASEPTSSEDLLARLNTELEANPAWRH